jgi:5-methylcytosine-specific restriction endonuclease McrA
MARWEHMPCGTIQYGRRTAPPYDCTICVGGARLLVAPEQRGWRYVDNLSPVRQKDKIRALGGAGKKRRAITPARRLRLYERDAFTCAICEVDFSQWPVQLTLDHWIPVALGGPALDENLRTVCRPCNTEKADRMPDHVRGILRSAGMVIGESEIPLEALLDGFMRIACLECDGDPRGYELPDGRFWPCNRCKTSGVELVMC